MKKLILLLFGNTLMFAANAQGLDPEQTKIFPDKIIEMFVPLLLLFLLLDRLVSVLKARAEFRLKEKMLDKGVSEETMIKIFGEADAIKRMQSLKWFLFTLANGLALALLHFCRPWLVGQSGYLATGIVLLCNAVAFLSYYRRIAMKS